MRHENSLRVGLLLLILLLTANIVSTVLTTSSAQSYAQTSSRAKFMYKAVKAAPDEQTVQMVLDLFSRDGWELVTHDNEVLIFKK